MNKNRFFLIVEREYKAIVAKKSFILVTLLAPILMIGLMLVPALLMDMNSSDARLVSIVDMSGKYGKDFKDTDDYKFQVLENTPIDKIKQQYEKADGDIYAILVIPANVETTHQVNIYSDNPVKMSLNNEVEDVLEKSLSDAKISSYDIPGLADIIEKSQISVSVKSHTWDEEGESVSSSTLSMIIGMALAMLTYVFVLMYGAMIMSSVVEDKTNRIVEVIVSSCRPLELMLGKIVSIALVGLTQIAVWSIFVGIGLFALSAIGFTSSPADTAQLQGEMAQLPISEGEEIVQAILGVDWGKLLFIFVLYFIGGYLLYASLFAGFGSAVDQQSDANQFMTPVMMIIILALLIGEGCMQDPDGTLGVICSFIPFTSPIVMMIRLPYDVPAWEIATSVLLLYGTAFLFTFFASRIYRTGILMYGRKVTFKELLKWAR
ncbi:ABC transporter permease [uncultured Muribaculum sp.]|uniref:ABC transporter permease n=1 Tax=uncultured Muribaculum sp. TaxID=1918613 RepID=UPI0025969488|nr:ABC transporter permease [uncultured Muribaculum sp.]